MNMHFGLTFSQIEAMLEDATKLAAKFAAEGNEDAEFDCLVDVGVYQAMLESHPEHPANR